MSDWREVTVDTGDSEMWNKQTPISGELRGARDNVGPNSAKLYTILTDKGEVAFWGSTVLDDKLSQLSIHDQVRITPLGKKQSPKTGREYMDFRVEWKPGTDPKPEPESKAIPLDEIPF